MRYLITGPSFIIRLFFNSHFLVSNRNSIRDLVPPSVHLFLDHAFLKYGKNWSQLVKIAMKAYNRLSSLLIHSFIHSFIQTFIHSDIHSDALFFSSYFLVFKSRARNSISHSVSPSVGRPVGLLAGPSVTLYF